MKIDIHALLLATFIGQASILFACAKPATANTPTAPTCNVQSEDCRDAWYAYGDQTGDYGIVDAAE